MQDVADRRPVAHVGHGVDGVLQADEGEKLQAAKGVAAKFNCIAAVTGQVDYVSNGKQVLVLNGGNEMLKKITGTGCITTTFVCLLRCRYKRLPYRCCFGRGNYGAGC